MEVMNEMGVIVEFAKEAPRYGIEIVSISADFPDAIIKIGERDYRVEFEFDSRNFILHRHDPRQCDLIICWIDNLNEPGLPIWELSRDDWFEPIPELSEIERELLYWKYRARIAEAKARKLNKKLSHIDTSKTGEYIVCEYCDAPFETVQALNAHGRWCKEKAGKNGKGLEAVY